MRAVFCIVLVLAFLQAGCSTIIIVSESSNIFPYCGTMVDSVVFITFITGGTEGTGLTSFDGILLALWALVDLPFSIIADTYAIVKLFL